MGQETKPVAVAQGVATPLGQEASTVSVVPSGSYANFLTDYHIGDHAGMLGVLVSIVGLWLTYREAKRSRTAAEAARDAARDARRGRLLVDVSMDLSAIYEQLSQLKQTIRSEEWASISRQIDSLCRSLEAVRQAMLIDGSEPDFTQADCDIVKEASIKLREFETMLTKKNAKPPVEEKSQNALQKQIVTPLTMVIDEITRLQHRAKLISAKR